MHLSRTPSSRCASFQGRFCHVICFSSSKWKQQQRCHAEQAQSVYLSKLLEGNHPKCQHLCYLLASENGGRTYAGYTTDVQRRLKQHNGVLKGGAKATRSHGPWYLLGTVTSPAFASKGVAMSFEWHCKNEHIPAALLRAAKGVGEQKAAVRARLARAAVAVRHSKFAGATFHIAVRQDVLALMDAFLQHIALDQQRQQQHCQQEQDEVLDLKRGSGTRENGTRDGGMGGADSQQHLLAALGEAPKKKRGRPPCSVSKVTGSRIKGKSVDSAQKAHAKSSGTKESSITDGDMSGIDSQQHPFAAQGEAPKKKRGRPPGAVGKVAGSKREGNLAGSAQKAEVKTSGK